MSAAAGSIDLQRYVERARAAGELVVQPRMGMASPDEMAAGLASVAAARGARTAGTITLDSYTRVGDHASARRALENGDELNGFPIVAHGAGRTAGVLAGAGAAIPVQVRHGSAAPGDVFRTMVRAGLSASEGGPVSYCLPYGRTPLAESVRHWDEAVAELAGSARAAGLRAHLETFGGCMLGQLCPPSLLIALSVLEAIFFAQRGVTSVSLSYTQQTDAAQDVEALAALRLLAARYLPDGVDRHLVLYTYMGVYPRTPGGARLLLDGSARIAVRGGAERLIVKTAAEAHRVPSVAENVAALERAARVARRAGEEPPSAGGSAGDSAGELDCSEVLDEARTLIEAVLEGSGDVGAALLRAFSTGVLDVPYCLHRDNLGLTRTRIDPGGRLAWARTGRMPLTAGDVRQEAAGARHLLSMLRFTADRCDREAPAAGGGERTALEESGEAEPYRVAIVGSGPRGLAVLERLAARLKRDPGDRPAHIHLCDAHDVGAGRIWRPDQDPWFLMNTAADEVTMFSGPRDGGPARPGAGPTLAQWWTETEPVPESKPETETEPATGAPGGYAPRALYGRYLKFVLDAVERDLPATVTLHRLRTEVTGLVPEGRAYRLVPADGPAFLADRVVLATGHPRPRPDAAARRFAAFAAARPALRHIRADSAADMPLNDVPAGAATGVIGLGLAFYDVMSALTIGRGGRFVSAADGGRLRYLPGGGEPLLVAGSRSGVPVPARGRNQKPPDWRYRPWVFTLERIRAMRDAGPLDFRRDVLPLLLTEMELVRHACVIRHRHGPDAARRFTARAAGEARVVAEILPAGTPDVLAAHADRAGTGDLAPLDLGSLTRPFAGRRFAGPAEFDAALAARMHEDLQHAEAGNVDGPLKAALDVIRDVRNVLRAAVDHAGLTPESHRDFLTWFGPAGSFLAAGPPPVRIRQVLALMEAGVLRVIGPSARFEADPGSGRFRASSDQVAGAAVPLDVLIDARIPVPELRADPAPLTRCLHGLGLWSSFVNSGGAEVFDTDAVAVTGPPFHPVRADGRPERGLYVLGLPCERTRWFQQVGSARPGRWDGFVQDADAIAADVASGAAAARQAAGPARQAGDHR